MSHNLKAKFVRILKNLTNLEYFGMDATHDDVQALVVSNLPPSVKEIDFREGGALMRGRIWIHGSYPLTFRALVIKAQSSREVIPTLEYHGSDISAFDTSRPEVRKFLGRIKSLVLNQPDQHLLICSHISQV